VSYDPMREEWGEVNGVDILASLDQGRYVSSDVAETLSAFMVNSMPDHSRSHSECRQVCDGGASTQKRRFDLEQLWKEITKSYDVDVLCGYSLGSFQGGIGSHIFHKLCAAHSAVDSR
jgi:hypothetical protein